MFSRDPMRSRLRFERTMDSAFRTPRYGAAIEIPTRAAWYVRLWRAVWAWL